MKLEPMKPQPPVTNTLFGSKAKLSSFPVGNMSAETFVANGKGKLEKDGGMKMMSESLVCTCWTAGKQIGGQQQQRWEKEQEEARCRLVIGACCFLTGRVSESWLGGHRNFYIANSSLGSFVVLCLRQDFSGSLLGVERMSLMRRSNQV
jgi:hypothetical protein